MKAARNELFAGAHDAELVQACLRAALQASRSLPEAAFLASTATDAAAAVRCRRVRLTGSTLLALLVRLFIVIQAQPCAPRFLCCIARSFPLSCFTKPLCFPLLPPKFVGGSDAVLHYLGDDRRQRIRFSYFRRPLQPSQQRLHGRFKQLAPRGSFPQLFLHDCLLRQQVRGVVVRIAGVGSAATKAACCCTRGDGAFVLTPDCVPKRCGIVGVPFKTSTQRRCMLACCSRHVFFFTARATIFDIIDVVGAAAAGTYRGTLCVG